MVGAILVYLSLRLKRTAQRNRFRRHDVANTDNQFRFLEDAELCAVSPINREAFKVFRAMEAMLAHRRSRCRLLAEVAMGGFIKTSRNQGDLPQRRRAYSAYGSKRVDFLIIDAFGRPALAVEYNGSGHQQANAAARDAVKKRALQKAGVALLEVYEHTAPVDYLRSMSSMLDRHEAQHRARPHGRKRQR